MKRRTTATRAGLIAAALVASALVLPATADARQGSSTATAKQHSAADTRYSVLLADGASRAAGVAAVEAAGGHVTASNDDVGLLAVDAPAQGFITEVTASAAVAGAARQRAIGSEPSGQVSPSQVATVERENRLGASTSARLAREQAATDARTSAKKKGGHATAGMDPMDDQLWGLRMVRSDLARQVNAGDRRVLVGIIDTGVDPRNPDIAPHFDSALSRNFTTDMPEIDGPCEFAGCVDPASWDDSGHGTHVAGTIGAAANGFGISGVAPNVTLVNVRAGQDSGYFFLQPTVDALTYAGDAGIDVVNMSFYVDPWLYNCTANPADSPEAQIEQRTIITAMNRALGYAHRNGVTLVSALGNEHTDLGNPTFDDTSPDFPVDAAYERTVDNSCLNLPAEGPHVISVSSLGPSQRKSDFSNYGVEQTDVSAPGGWFRDGIGTPTYRTNGNLILSSYPVNVLQAEGQVDADGNITQDGVDLGTQKACDSNGRCGYYAFLQGTSMASPHAVGVAALVISAWGHKEGHGGFGMNPNQVEHQLLRTAADHACPAGGVQSYTDVGRDDSFTATCTGTTARNGFYGEGIVDAYQAVTSRR